MRGFKFGVVLCSAMIGVGVVGTGSALGKLYKDYYDEEVLIEELLDIEAMNKVSIQADMPIRIEETTEQPKVIYKAQVQGIKDLKKEYAVEVETDGDKTVIEVDNDRQGINFEWVQEEELVVFLPKKEMQELIVEAEHAYSLDTFTYSGDNTIKEVDLTFGGEIKVELKGNYEDVAVEGRYGTLKMSTGTPTELELKGGIQEVELKGAYKQIDTTLESAELKIFPTQPIESIYLEGYAGEVYMELPTGHKGFEVVKPYDAFEDNNQFYTNVDAAQSIIGETKESRTYGEQETKIFVTYDSTQVTIIE